MAEIEQLDVFGNAQPWEETTPKAQAAHNKQVIQQEKRDHADNLVLEWMRQIGRPVSVRELTERLEPVGLAPSTTFAAMKRLRHAGRIGTGGRPDYYCDHYQVLGCSRWVPVKIEEHD